MVTQQLITLIEITNSESLMCKTLWLEMDNIILKKSFYKDIFTYEFNVCKNIYTVTNKHVIVCFTNLIS